MSVYDLPFCDYCGFPYHNGLPTCDCEAILTCSPLPTDCPQLDTSPPYIEGISCKCCKERGLIQDDQAVVMHCSKLNSNCS